MKVKLNCNVCFKSYETEVIPVIEDDIVVDIQPLETTTIRGGEIPLDNTEFCSKECQNEDLENFLDGVADGSVFKI